MELAHGIHMISGTVGTRPLQLFLLWGEQRRVLLDTGCAPDPERLVFPYLSSVGLRPTDLDLVINTHPDSDHCGGNSAVKRASPGTLITCGEADRELVGDPEVLWSRRYNAYAEKHGIAYDEQARLASMEALGGAAPVDFTWRGGETLRLSRDWVVEIHHTPGHSRGHLSVFDPRSGGVLIGDAVQGRLYADMRGNPALCPTYLYVDPYLATIRYLRTMKPALLAGCHWPIKRGPEVEAFLDETQQFVQSAEIAIIDRLSHCSSTLTLSDLIREIGPSLGDWPRETDRELVYALAGHMDDLTARGQVVADQAVTPVRYRLRPVD